ncbi:glucoamylase family protein [Elusimicrobiota bacterium]
MCVFTGCVVQKHPVRSDINEPDYLDVLLRETWDYLDDHLAPQTGFPTDSQCPGGVTNTTNIGLYLASVGPAVKMGYIKHKDAYTRIKKILDSLYALDSKRGFLPNWISVEGRTSIPAGVFAVSDFNKLITGLILVRQFFPGLEKEVSGLIERVQWSWLYDNVSGKMHWGYDLMNDSPVGLTDLWLAADTRMAMFYTVACGAAPPQLWDMANRNIINADGLQFYSPGYEFGGLFMSAIGSIFLDEKGTEVGKSIADLAWHQIREAKRRGLPLWGWSNCNIPGRGYTEGGFLPWWVVTPHASALVIEYYPGYVLKNLKTFEEMGLRKPLKEGGLRYGFRDSVDLRSGMTDNRYLCLDQAMLFLSIINYVTSGMVREYFRKDPLVSNGYKLLGDRLKNDPSLIGQWRARDISVPEAVGTDGTAEDVCTVNMVNNKDIVVQVQKWGDNSNIDAYISEDGLVVDFDLGADGSGEVEARCMIPVVDMRVHGDVSIKCMGESARGYYGIRMYLRDDQGQSKYAFLNGIQTEVNEFEIQEKNWLGIFARPNAVNTLVFKFWGRPWYYQNERTRIKKGKLVVKSISFNRQKAIDIKPRMRERNPDTGR